MGKLDKQIKLRPNAAPGFIEAKVILTSDSLKDIDMLPEKALTGARRYAGECTKENKKSLKNTKSGYTILEFSTIDLWANVMRPTPLCADFMAATK